MEKSNDIVKNTSQDNGTYVELEIPNTGLGRMVTTSTRILMDLMLEDSLHSRVRVLKSVIEHLDIEVEDFNRMRRNDKRWEKLDYDNDEAYSWENNNS